MICWIAAGHAGSTEGTTDEPMSNPSLDISNDELWMNLALRYAKKAGSRGEVPVGSVLVLNNSIVSYGYNLREKLQSPLGHAELIALERASGKLGAWRLSGTTLYVTLEPCLMCAGAIVQSRVQRVVFGTWDPKGGALESLYKVGEDIRLNHRFQVTGGVLSGECAQLLSDFFRSRRRNSSNPNR